MRLPLKFKKDDNTGLFLPYSLIKISWLFRLCCRIPYLVKNEKDKIICDALTRATKLAFLVGIPFLFIIAFVIGYRVDTHIRADFTVNEFTFVLDKNATFDSIIFQAIDIYNFERIELSPSHLELKEIDSWQPIEAIPTITVTPKDEALKYNAKIQTPEENVSLLEIELVTGRTHQIRVHFAHLGNSVVGDSVYGYKTDDPIALHASEIEFDHPETNESIKGK